MNQFVRGALRASVGLAAAGVGVYGLVDGAERVTDRLETMSQSMADFGRNQYGSESQNPDGLLVGGFEALSGLALAAASVTVACSTSEQTRRPS